MKTKFILMVVALLMLSSCCNKTSHCIVTDNAGNIVKDYGTKKGTSSDIKNYESHCKGDASQYNGTITCNGMMMH